MFGVFKRWTVLVPALVMFLLSACAAPSAVAPTPSNVPTQAAGQSPVRSDSLVNTRWVLTSIGDPTAATPVIEGSWVTLELTGETRAVGSGGCNNFGAEYKVQGEDISFKSLSTTMKACDTDPIMRQEQRYFLALQNASTFSRKGDRMLVFFDYNGAKGVMNFVQASFDN